MILSLDPQKNPIIYILSDSIGETGEIVVKAAVSQFDSVRMDIRRIPYLSTELQVEDALVEVAATPRSIIVYTLVRQDLRLLLERRTKEQGIMAVDVMGPMIEALQSVVTQTPKYEAGTIRRIDDAYFNKVEAIEFAVKFDDGKEPRGLLRADIVVTGISRTSKTPLCMYLAGKGIKAANTPLVPEVAPPPELFQVPSYKVVGLIIDPTRVFEIRRERLKTMGLSPNASYANLERIMAELEYARGIMARIGCPIIDVTNKATEETAAKILEYYYKGVDRT